ncbi:MAG: creatininase family protein [Thermoplasmata archaeon]|nr:creatininase family protein [Thermoplasmata archaeon]
MKQKKGKKVVRRRVEKVVRLMEMNWKEIDGLDREKTVFFLPISPLEEHGPHLPVGTDLLITEEAAKEAIRVLMKKKTGVYPVLLPSIPVGHSSLAMDFPGTLSVDAYVIRDVVYGVASSLARYGFKYLLICTYHMDPFYVKAIYKGIRKVMSRYPMMVVEPTSAYFYGDKSEEGDIHAGYDETSVMLYLYPYLLDSSYKSLPECHLSSFSTKDFRKTLRELGAVDGYVGDPSRAAIDHGKRLFTELVELYVTAAVDLHGGRVSSSIPRLIRWLPLFLQRKH